MTLKPIFTLFLIKYKLINIGNNNWKNLKILEIDGISEPNTGIISHLIQ